jgi:hypothetical protein
MKRTIKKGRHAFSPRIIGWPFHRGVRMAQWRGNFHEDTWYEPLDAEHDYNKGGGWSYGWHQKNSIRWGWRPVRHQGQKMQEICLYTYENRTRCISEQTILMPLQEDFFVQLKANGGYAIVSARTFTGDWKTVTGKWGARPRLGYWLGLYFGGTHPAPHDMAVDLMRL